MILAILVWLVVLLFCLLIIWIIVSALIVFVIFLLDPKKDLNKANKKVQKVIVHEFTIIKKLISTWCRDIRLVYKNFIHWNICKILVRFWAVFFAALLWLPVLLLLLLLMYVDPIVWWDVLGSLQIWTLDMSILNNIWFVLVEWFLMMVYLCFLGLGWFYAGALQFYVYRKYLEADELLNFKNFYFDIPKFYRFSILTWWRTLYAMIPLFVFIGFLIISIWVFSLYFGSMKNFVLVLKFWQVNFFSLLTFLVWIICFIWLIYINLRMIFSTILFVEDLWKTGEIVWARSYVKESIKKTYGLAFILRFLAYFFVFGFALGILSLPGDILVSKMDDIGKYVNFTSQSGSTVESIEDPDQQEYYRNLQGRYASSTPQQLLTDYNVYSWQHFFRKLIFFFLLEGVMEMALYSFYKHNYKR